MPRVMISPQLRAILKLTKSTMHTPGQHASTQSAVHDRPQFKLGAHSRRSIGMSTEDATHMKKTLQTRPLTAGDRARFYRMRIRAQTKALEDDTRDQKQHIETLRILIDVQRRLSSCMIGTVRKRILDHISYFIQSKAYLSRHDDLRGHQLQVQAIDVNGDPSTPVVRIHATLNGTYSQRAISRMYTFVPGNTRVMSQLMHHNVAIPCCLVVYFSSEGDLEFKTVKKEYVSVLVSHLGSPQDVSAVLRAFEHSP